MDVGDSPGNRSLKRYKKEEIKRKKLAFEEVRRNTKASVHLGKLLLFAI